jgi:hypothetical protein
MRKLISEEVSRIQEIMGFKPSIITEAVGPISPQAEKEILEWIIGLFSKAETRTIKTASGKLFSEEAIQSFIKKTQTKLDTLGLQRGLNMLTKEESDILKAITRDEIVKNPNILINIAKTCEQNFFRLLNSYQKEVYIGTYLNRMGKILSDTDIKMLKDEIEPMLTKVTNPGHSAGYKAPDAVKPVTPVTKAASSNDFIKFFTMGPGALHQQILDALKKGTDVVAGIAKNREVLMLKPYFEQGLIKNKEDVYYKLKELFDISKAAKSTNSASTVEMLPLSNIRRPNGSVGVQGYTPEFMINLVDHISSVRNLNLPKYSSLKEMIESLRKLPKVKQEIMDYVKKDPIELRLEPDGSYQVVDGHHRANLLNLLEFDAIPVVFEKEMKSTATGVINKVPQISPSDVTIEGTFDGYKVIKGSKETAIGDIRQEAAEARAAGKSSFTKETVKDGKKTFTLVDAEHSDNFGRGGFKAVSVTLPADTKLVMRDVMPTLEAAMKGEKAVPTKTMAKVRPYETGDVVVTGTKPGSGVGVVSGKDFNLPDYRVFTQNPGDKSYRGTFFKEFDWGNKKVFAIIDGSILDGAEYQAMGRDGFISVSIVLDKSTTTVLNDVKADLESLLARTRTGLNSYNKIDVNKVKQQMSGVKWVSHEVKPVTPVTKAPEVTNEPKVQAADAKAGESLTPKSAASSFPMEQDQSKLKKIYSWFDSKFYEANGKRHDRITDAQIDEMLPETKKYILTIMEDLKEFHPQYSKEDGAFYNIEKKNEIVDNVNDALKIGTQNMFGGFGRYSKMIMNNIHDKIPFPPVHAPTREVIDNLNQIFPSSKNGINVDL